MGYSPGFLLNIGQFGNHGSFPKILNGQSCAELEIRLQACGRRFRVFGAISSTCTYQNPPCPKSMGYSPGFLLKNCQFRTLGNSVEIFTNNNFYTCWRCFSEFGTISVSYPNPPSSKPWAAAKVFWSKSTEFGPMGIFPKSSPIVLYTVWNPFASTLAIF